jgi:Transglycosylase SLT domain
MSSARSAKAIGYVAAGFLALTAVISGVAVALTHSGSQQAKSTAAVVAAANTASGTTATPAPSAPSQGGVDTTKQVALKVPPLRKLTPPDVVVTMRHAPSSRAVRRLRAVSGVRRVVLADRGTIAIHHVRLTVLGVPLSTIRGFTPALTAKSTALWQSVARGELTVAYANAKNLHRHLGATYSATGPQANVAALRVGAFATLGLPGVQGLLSLPAAKAVGLLPRRVALVTAPQVSIDDLRSDVAHAFGASAHIVTTRPVVVNQSISSSYADSTIPATYLDLYRRAAVTCPGLPWTVLAGIGTVETGNGRDVHRSSAGAEGPMQFEPSTWAMYGYDADGDGKADINDPTDAIFSAARYLCAAGAGRGGQSIDDAIFSYNHAWWYVREVVSLANQYA